MGKEPSYKALAEKVEVLEKELAISRQAEAALRKSEQRYRTLLDFMPYPVAVFDARGRVSYINPGFTETFGWSLEELKGKIIPFVPENLKGQTALDIKRLFEDKILQSHVTRRQTKDGRTLDVVSKVAFFTDPEGGQSEVLAIHRDVTREKRVTLHNEAMLRISLALPRYPSLADLMDYITDEIKGLLEVEGAIVLLLDQEKMEFFTLGAAYDDKARRKRMMEVRFPVHKLVSGKVIQSGRPIIVNDPSQEPELHEERDRIMGYKTATLLAVPLIIGERIIGTLSAVNKKVGRFDQTDTELLSMIASTVALSIENARVSDEIQKAYNEVSSMNRAKDKVINHLSHELRTPIAILAGSLKLFQQKLEGLPEATWKPTLERARRNLDRIIDIQFEVDDIMGQRRSRAYDLLNLILNQCADELETLIAEQVGEGPVIAKVREKVEELFGLKEIRSEQVPLSDYVQKRLEHLRPRFAHRELHLDTRFEPAPPILIPEEVLQKVVDGLIKNAVENTPDEGRILVRVGPKDKGAELVVHDYGVGITEEDKRRIFEGFFVTQETMTYSTKRPYDFNAGGKGADLLRMKIFSERYGFKIDMQSKRCPCLTDKNTCPGRISTCPFCKENRDCHESGGTTFSLFFPPAGETQPI